MLLKSFKKGNKMGNDKIVQSDEYGKHIPIICRKCGVTGNTKNISCIGARSIFFDPTSVSVIGCPHDFVPQPPENWVELSVKYNKAEANNLEREEIIRIFRTPLRDAVNKVSDGNKIQKIKALWKEEMLVITEFFNNLTS